MISMAGDSEADIPVLGAGQRVELLPDIEESQGDAFLVVDLDGTLVHTDLLLEGLVGLVRINPLLFFLVPFWLWRGGPAALKRAVAQRVALDARSLPYNEDLLTYLRRQKQRGRDIVLATAADRLYADAVATHLGLFKDIIASDGILNVRGQAKADAIRDYLGAERFVYVGNDLKDLPVFDHAAGAILVGPPHSLKQSIISSKKLLGVVDRPVDLRAAVRALRLHQWSKNLLVFLPAAAGHQIFSPDAFLPLGMAFLALSLTASSAYLFNDLLDLSVDRRHPTKRRRPMASGALPVWAGATLCPLSLFGAILIAAYLPKPVWLLLVIYTVASTLYSLYFKRKHLLDIVVLVGLYHLRLLVGHESAGIGYSYWFEVFFGFMFTSLGFLKRYDEVELDLPPGTSPLSKLDLGPFEVHSMV